MTEKELSNHAHAILECIVARDETIRAVEVLAILGAIASLCLATLPKDKLGGIADSWFSMILEST